MRAVIDRIESSTSGSGLIAAALTGATSLQVADSSDFDLGGGSLSLNDWTYAYTAVDPDADVITLGSALIANADVDDPVAALDETGAPGVEWTVWVDVGDDSDDAVPTTPNHALIPLFSDNPDDMAGTEVVIEATDEGYVTTSFASKDAVVGAASVGAPLFVGHLAVNQSIPDSTFTNVLSWNVTEQRAEMGYDALFGDVIVPMDGYYCVTNSAVLWESSGTGRRATQPMFTTAAGSVPGGLFNQAADASARQTTPVVSPLKPLIAGDKVRLQVSQTSGGSLPLIGDADGTKSFFCVEYRGPL